MSNCPRCQIAMVATEVAGPNYTLPIERCTQCQGHWLPRTAMDKLEAIVEPVMIEFLAIPKLDQLAGLHCPVCSEEPILIKADHHRDQRVVVDYCPDCHGTWLDKGELRAIQQENIFFSLYQLLKDLHR